jgi:hypothetical protein
MHWGERLPLLDALWMPRQSQQHNTWAKYGRVLVIIFFAL